ncbi:hypothetical protein LINPERHAP2_LOCUS14366 [Linum perenne]
MRHEEPVVSRGGNPRKDTFKLANGNGKLEHGKVTILQTMSEKAHGGNIKENPNRDKPQTSEVTSPYNKSMDATLGGEDGGIKLIGSDIPSGNQPNLTYKILIKNLEVHQEAQVANFCDEEGSWEIEKLEYCIPQLWVK